MVNDVVDLTLTKPRVRRGYFKGFKKWWAGLAVIVLLLAGFMLWPASPRDLGIGDRLLNSQVIPAWRNGELIVLVRHEERCDRSANPCFAAPEGLTVLGTQRAEEVGKAFKVLGMENSDVIASPALRTAQTSHFMFGKAELTTNEKPFAAKPLAKNSSATNNRDATWCLSLTVAVSPTSKQPWVSPVRGFPSMAVPCLCGCWLTASSKHWEKSTAWLGLTP